jgi:hypothetical protein
MAPLHHVTKMGSISRSIQTDHLFEATAMTMTTALTIKINPTSPYLRNNSTTIVTTINAATQRHQLSISGNLAI